MVLAASGLRTYEWILASLAGILNLGLALAIASGVITASVRPKAGQAPVFEGKPTRHMNRSSSKPRVLSPEMLPRTS